MPKIIAGLLCLFLAACETAPQVTIVKVVSSKPYRFIHYSPTDDPRTIKEVRDHNYRHAMVKKAEAEAEAKAKAKQ
jgi:hypothetical protein